MGPRGAFGCSAIPAGGDAEVGWPIGEGHSRAGALWPLKRKRSTGWTFGADHDGWGWQMGAVSGTTGWTASKPQETTPLSEPGHATNLGDSGLPSPRLRDACSYPLVPGEVTVPAT